VLRRRWVRSWGRFHSHQAMLAVRAWAAGVGQVPAKGLASALPARIFRVLPARPAPECPGGTSMRMDKLTSRFQQALGEAQSLAVGRDHNLIEPAHLLVALLDEPGGGTRPLLSQAGGNVPGRRERLGELLDKLPKVTGQAGNIGVGNDLSRLLNVTDKLAQQR